jgi:3-oxoacyl-[acyl-carrier-protein] synthase-3
LELIFLKEQNVGIAGIGIYLPDKFMTAKEIAEKTDIPENIIIEKFGIKKKYIPGPKDTTSHMGLEAAKDALNEAEVNPKDIDLIIWNGAQHKDYPCWLAGLKVADELGATNAWSFDMEAMCGSMMVGMDTAKSFMITHDDINTVLLVSGYRNVDLINLENPATTFMADIGAGGAAAVLKKNLNRNVILGSSFKGDGSFSEDCVVPVGGTKKWPMEPEDTKRYWFDIEGDMDDFKKRLGEKTMPNFYTVIRESLKKSGFKGDEDIDYLAILHFKKSAHYAVLDELGLKENQSIYLDDYGHTGQNDQILSLKLGLETGKIKDGSVVVMVGAGLGFVWAASTIKWGKY